MHRRCGGLRHRVFWWSMEAVPSPAVGAPTVERKPSWGRSIRRGHGRGHDRAAGGRRSGAGASCGHLTAAGVELRVVHIHRGVADFHLLGRVRDPAVLRSLASGCRGETTGVRHDRRRRRVAVGVRRLLADPAGRVGAGWQWFSAPASSSPPVLTLRCRMTNEMKVALHTDWSSQKLLLLTGRRVAGARRRRRTASRVQRHRLSSRRRRIIPLSTVPQNIASGSLFCSLRPSPSRRADLR